MVVIIVYPLKLKLMVWRAARCLRPCDRVLSFLSVMLLHLRTGGVEISNSCYSLPAKVNTDSIESCKVPDAL